MKKILLLLVCLFSFSAASFADDDRPISFRQLPERAQTFIKRHFRVTDVQKAFMDDDEYEVRLTNGVKIEFGKGGRWKEIESQRRGIPASIVPDRVMKRVRKQFGPQVRVMEISRDNEEIEVKLSNGKELSFDRESRKVEEDD